MSDFEPKQFGRYLLIDKLAVGGMAEIYKAKTYGVDGFEKLLAIKRILPHCAADKDFITMLVDEAKLTVLLSHANIVQVYDLGKVGDDYYISMEFIHGTNLRELIRRVTSDEGKMPEDLAVYAVSEMCKGLDYAHRKSSPDGQQLNIVHRDINPQNILISYEGEVKIVDFGIAKAALNVSHTMAGVLKGKIAYMSPEQALGKPLDGRTDIYSAGLVLYEMLTGEKFYTGETQFEVLNKIRTTRVNTMDLPDDIPGPLKAILAKALSFNAKDRYATAGDLHLELTKYLYSSYIDFSPRNLASLVRNYFDKEMKATEESGPHVDDKTRSLLIKASTGESLVGDEGQGTEAGIKDAGTGTDIGIDEESSVTDESTQAGAIPVPEPTIVRKQAKRRRPWMILAVFLALGAAGYLSWSQFGIGDKVSGLWEELVGPTVPDKPVKPVEPPEPKPPLADYGSIIVSSEPSNSTILLNGKNIGKTTPATLSRLSLGDDYKVSIEREHYKPYEKTVALVTEEPVKVHVSLQALAEGMLKISSDPPGAAILLNGKETGKVTPTDIGELEIKKDYAIHLKKEGYGDWASTVPIANFNPVNIRATLTKLPELPKLEEKPEPPPPPKLGSLVVRSKPGAAKVFLNGKDTGRVTPTQLDNLELDKFYTIKLEKGGYEVFTKSVKVEQESGDKLIASLDKGKAIPEPKPKPKPVEKPIREAKPTPKPKPEPRYTPPPEPKPEPRYTPPPAPKPVASGRPASLSIRSSPSGAEVYVNSEYKGKTPITVSGLRPGSASVMLRKDGFMQHSSSVSLQGGKKKSLGTIKLEGMFGEIKVETIPPRADVIFDGNRIGARTPVTIRKVPRNRSHSLRVEMNGFRPWSTSVDMSREKNKRYNVRLQKN